MVGNEFSRFIKSRQAYFEITNKDIAKKLEQTEKTVGKHINDPSLMSIGELRLYIKMLNIPQDAVADFLYK